MSCRSFDPALMPSLLVSAISLQCTAKQSCSSPLYAESETATTDRSCLTGLYVISFKSGT